MNNVAKTGMPINQIAQVCILSQGFLGVFDAQI